tara:strand:+ start:66 stop:449 length:384 start_codon:yes stop_codon:yes gene_type:complete
MATSDKFKGTKKDNEYFKTLSDDMRGWAKEGQGRVWIPTLITVPFAILYPFNENNKMKWGYALMIDIPEEERENYPDGNGGFYTQRYDTDNPDVYDEFVFAIAKMNETAKKQSPNPEEIKLPKLTKK